MPFYPGRVDMVSAAVRYLAAAGDPTSAGSAASDLLASISSFNPILNLGLGGVLVFLIIKRIGIMPTYVFKDAKDEWDRERDEMQASIARERAAWESERDRTDANRTRERDQARTDNDEAQATIKNLTTTIVEQVVPAVTRVAGPLTDLVRMKEAEERRDANRRNDSGGGHGR